MATYAESYVLPGQDSTFIAPVVGVLVLVSFVFLFGGGNEYQAREKARKKREAELKRQVEEELRRIQQLQFHIAFDKNNPEIRRQIDKALQEASQVNKNPVAPVLTSTLSPTARVAVLPNRVDGSASTPQPVEEVYMSGIEFSSHPRPNVTTIIED